MESWLPIEQSPEYEVSNCGSVRHGERILQPRMVTQNRRYQQVIIHGEQVYIHRLVASAFLGEIPAGFHVNHLDGDPTNNDHLNLEIVTPKENSLHRWQPIWYRTQTKLPLVDPTSEKKNYRYQQIVPRAMIEQIDQIEEKCMDIPGYKREYLYQIVSVVAFSTRRDGEPAPLKFEYLKKEVPGGHHYLKALLKAGIVERVGSYQPGSNSYKYRISEAYRGDVQLIPVTNAKLINRIEQRQKLGKGRRSVSEAQTRFIRQMQIDPEALEAARSIQDPKKQFAAVASVVAIQNRELFHTLDQTAGRYHSNFTNLWGPLRRYVTIQGQYLISIDLANSQPFFSLLLLTDPEKLATFAKDANFFMNLKSLQPVESEDSKTFIKLVVEGRIYEFLIGEFQQHGFTYSRDDVKTKFFQILFSSNLTRTPEKTIFKRLFPSVYQRFQIVKGSSRSNDRNQNYKRLAILLQRVEAHLILEKILPRIYRERPGIPAVSIHDSVSVSTGIENAEYVQKVMTEELTAFTGLQPTLKIETAQNFTSFFNSKYTYREKGKEETGQRGCQYESQIFVIN